MTTEWTATLPRKRMGAGILFRDPDNRILLVEPTYKPYWELPGGVVEADESPRDAAAALDGLRSGTAAYLEDGVKPSP